MTKQVCAGAKLVCSFGSSPSTLQLVSGNPAQVNNQLAATIQEHKAMVNIQPFGMCSAPTNPQVMVATAAAMGVLTPQPCQPVTSTPWQPGSSTIQINKQPSLTIESTCMCTWLGSISIQDPGQQIVNLT